MKKEKIEKVVYLYKKHSFLDNIINKINRGLVVKVGDMALDSEGIDIHLHISRAIAGKAEELRSELEAEIDAIL